MCPAWHNEEWPDDECDDPAHGCHQAAQSRRDHPEWDEMMWGQKGEPGPPGEGPARRWPGRPLTRPPRPARLRKLPF